MIIDKLSGSRVHFEVTVSKDMFEHALDHAFAKVNQNVEIKGFRKGHAPRDVYEARYGVESLYEEAIQHALEETYYETIMEHNIEVVSQPEIDLDVAKVKRGSDFTYKITVAVKPEIVLGDYLGLEVSVLPETATDLEIDQEIDRERDKNAEMVLKEEGVLEQGDTAVFDFSGSVDGVKFEGGTAENHELVIGSGQFIPGFEEQMLGMASESEKDVVVTFPEDYHEKTLAGKEAVFAVKLHEIKVRQVPELNDEFVKELNLEGVSTVKEYRDHIKATLEESKHKQNEKHIRETVIDKAVKNATFELPEAMVKDEAKRMDENNRNQIKQYKLDFNTYLQYLGKTEAEYLAELNQQATKILSQQLVIEAIGKKEQFPATPEEVEAKYEEIVDQYKSQNVTMTQAKQAIPESAIKDEIIYKKATDLLVEKAKIDR